MDSSCVGVRKGFPFANVDDSKTYENHFRTSKKIFRILLKICSLKRMVMI